MKETRKGMLLVISGPSGAGKTTMIKILTGQLEAGSGRVEVFGKDVKTLTGADKKSFGIMMDMRGLPAEIISKYMRISMGCRRRI